MTQIGSTSAGGLRHRRIGRNLKSSLLMALAILATASIPLAAHAEAPNPLCAGCHNEDGNSAVGDFPKISGLDAAYITKQITDFKKYKRVSEAIRTIFSSATSIVEPLSLDEAYLDLTDDYRTEAPPARRPRNHGTPLR